MRTLSYFLSKALEKHPPFYLKNGKFSKSKHLDQISIENVCKKIFHFRITQKMKPSECLLSFPKRSLFPKHYRDLNGKGFIFQRLDVQIFIPYVKKIGRTEYIPEESHKFYIVVYIYV